jgi:hypothetical protein
MPFCDNTSAVASGAARDPLRTAVLEEWSTFETKEVIVRHIEEVLAIISNQTSLAADAFSQSTIVLAP